MIRDADDYRLMQRDGLAWTEHRLDWTGRLFITGYDGEKPDELIATHCTSHSLAAIREAHDFYGAVLARLEREQ